MKARIVAIALAFGVPGCDESGPSSATAPSGPGRAVMRLVFQGPTARRVDLPASAQACVAGDEPGFAFTISSNGTVSQ
jgi:hypothetical protein